jgi:hexosaminidase
MRLQKMAPSTSINIIPQPASVQLGEGNFGITAETKIYFHPAIEPVQSIATALAEKMNAAIGLDLIPEPLNNSATPSNAIRLTISPNQAALGAEGYELLVQQQSVRLIAHQPAGLFYGVQTLRQLLPPEIESTQRPTQNRVWQIPGVKIVDKPRFGWRGMLLDCCRHFMTKDFVKRYIDLLAYYKMNRFHWHLTEDQGWRIEIKKYPKLTEVGAWRKYEDGTIHGGFYTQDDIKEVVAYAQTRFVTVIPEIELPGHSLAALACYPQLSCTGGPFEVSTRWGVHKDVYCAGNEATFQFLADVFTEVVDLFPAAYIHIGGDEVPKDRWQQCSKCQARIKAQGLHDEHELQSYFVKRIEQLLSSKGRRIIGWDEILEGGLAPGATVQSWRGLEGAIAAATSGHDAIVSPTSHAYFDYPIETLDLRQVYSFEPVPSGLTEEQARHILGGECNMWTEYAPQETIDSKMFPRLLAMSEVLWSPKQAKNYREFHQRLRYHYQRLNFLGVKYGAESHPISILPSFDPAKNAFKIAFEAGESDLQIYYTLDGTAPTPRSNAYRSPLHLKKSALIRAQAFRDGHPYGEPTEKQFFFHLATGKPTQLKYAYSPKYTGGGKLGLTDGITGSINFRDGFWQGFEQDDLEAVIDLGKVMPLRKIITTFLQNAGAWIFMPRFVHYAISNDGENFTDVALVENDTPTDYPDAIIKEFKAKVPATQARYIKLFAKNIGTCPPSHPGAGGKAWIFVDEIVVQ